MFKFILIYKCLFRFEPGKPKQNPANYTDKAKKLGYIGDREYFSNLDNNLTKQSREFIEKVAYFKVFQHVKAVLDSTKSVTEDCY